MSEEGLMAWLHNNATDETYPLGLVKDGLGWVSETNLQMMAELDPDGRILFFQWHRGEVSNA